MKIQDYIASKNIRLVTVSYSNAKGKITDAGVRASMKNFAATFSRPCRVVSDYSERFNVYGWGDTEQDAIENFLGKLAGKSVDIYQDYYHLKSILAFNVATDLEVYEQTLLKI